MSASKEDEDEEVVFEETNTVCKNMGKPLIIANRETIDRRNGTIHTRLSSVDSSFESEDEDDEEEESESDLSVQMPVFRTEDGKTDEIGKDDILSNIQFQKSDDPRALLTHETLCALRQNIDTLNEPRDPKHTSTSINGVVLPDPIHAMQAMDHNLWVLASAASLRLNEVGERCKLLMTRNTHDKTQAQLTEVLPKALAALSGQQIGFKEKEPEKPEPKGKKGRSAATPAANKPLTRERAVRERAEPKKKPPQAKEIIKSSFASPRPIASAKQPASVVNETARNGKVAKKDEETSSLLTNTRKRKHAKEKEEKDEKKDSKTPAKAKAAVATAKRASNRTTKKTKEDEPTYCHCNRISFGEMVGCDNEKCAIEWFHFECINIKVKPKGKWYCPDCRAEPHNSKQPKKSSK